MLYTAKELNELCENKVLTPNGWEDKVEIIDEYDERGEHVQHVVI